VTESCAEEAAFTIRVRANSQRTRDIQVCEAGFLISQLIFIKSSMPSTTWLAIVVAVSSPGTRRVNGEHLVATLLLGVASVHSSQIERFLPIKSFCSHMFAVS